MADKSIGELPQAPQVQPDSMIPLEQNGQAMRMTGEQFADFAREAAAADVQRAVDAANSAGQSQVAAQAAAARAEAARDSIVLDEQKLSQAVQDAAGSVGAASNQADRAKTEADRAESEADEAEEWAAKAQGYAESASTPAVSGVYNIVMIDRVTAQRYALIVENGTLVLLGVSAALDATEPVRIDTVTGTAYYIAVEDGVIVLDPVEEV